MTSEAPLATFGVIADVQHAPRDDGWNFARTHTRYYRASADALEAALKEWEDRGDVPLVLQLGDVIDGFNSREMTTETAMERVGEALAAFPGRVLSALGNHELYNGTRAAMKEWLMPAEQLASDEFWYGTFRIADGLRVVMLDSYEISAMSGAPNAPEREAALAVLAERNPNNEKNSPVGLEGVERRFVAFNGQIGEQQLAWLADELADATAAGDAVLVMAHIPVFPGACDPKCLLWNYAEVHALLESSPCVKAFFCGHDHVGGYAVSPAGVHHWTLPGVLEGPAPEDHRYAVLQAFADRLEVLGMGEEWVPSVMRFR